MIGKLLWRGKCPRSVITYFIYYREFYSCRVGPKSEFYTLCYSKILNFCNTKTIIAMISVIQIAFLSLVMAQQPSDNINLDGWWFRVTPERTPVSSPSTTCLLQSQAIVKRDDYTYTEGIGGHKVHTRALTWAGARRTCEEEGGHLAIINSIVESKAISDLWKSAEEVVGGTANTEYASIGFHDLFEEGEFITVHGQTLSRAGFAQWALYQPDDANDGEDCGAVNKDGELNDVPCSKTFAFVCELPIY